MRYCIICWWQQTPLLVLPHVLRRIYSNMAFRSSYHDDRQCTHMFSVYSTNLCIYLAYLLYLLHRQCRSIILRPRTRIRMIIWDYVHATNVLLLLLTFNVTRTQLLHNFFILSQWYSVWRFPVNFTVVKRNCGYIAVLLFPLFCYFH